jgi:hypothetical protein
MQTDAAVQRVPPSGGSGGSQDTAEPPDWFDRVFTGDGEPPRLPKEPNRRRWDSYGDVQYAVYFLLGLCCGLLIAYSIYHLGGRW